MTWNYGNFHSVRIRQASTGTKRHALAAARFMAPSVLLLLFVVSVNGLAIKVATTTAVNRFAEGTACVKRGDLVAAQRHFAEHLALHPDHEQTRAILSRLEALGGVEDELSDNVATKLRFGNHSVTLIAPAADRTSKLSCDSSGTMVWSGAPVLLDWLSEEGRVDALGIRGARVLELGSGHGLVGCGIAKLGARRVSVSDLPQMMPLLQANLEANEDECNVEGCELSAQPLAWGTTAGGPFTCDDERPWDLVVGANLCYDEALIEQLATTLVALLSVNDGTIALLSLSDLQHFGHDRPDYEVLTSKLEEGGFRVRRLASIDPSESNERLRRSGVMVGDAEREHMIDIFIAGNAFAVEAA